MDEKTAREISAMWTNNEKMDAIRVLRSETSMGLMSAKLYLEGTYDGGPMAIFHKLCEEFCIPPQERLRVLRKQRDELDKQIELVELEIEESCKKPDVFTVNTAQELTAAMMPDIYTDEELNIG